MGARHLAHEKNDRHHHQAGSDHLRPASHHPLAKSVYDRGPGSHHHQQESPHHFGEETAPFVRGIVKVPQPRRLEVEPRASPGHPRLGASPVDGSRPGRHQGTRSIPVGGSGTGAWHTGRSKRDCPPTVVIYPGVGSGRLRARVRAAPQAQLRAVHCSEGLGPSPDQPGWRSTHAPVLAAVSWL